jgi:hypothetical protein
VSKFCFASFLTAICSCNCSNCYFIKHYGNLSSLLHTPFHLLKEQLLLMFNPTEFFEGVDLLVFIDALR